MNDNFFSPILFSDSTCRSDPVCCFETSGVRSFGSGAAVRGRGEKRPVDQNSPLPTAPRQTLIDYWSSPPSGDKLTADTPPQSQQTRDLRRKSKTSSVE